MKFTIALIPLLAVLAATAPTGEPVGELLDISKLAPEDLAEVHDVALQALESVTEIEKRDALEKRYNHCSKCSSHGSMICTNCSLVGRQYLCFTQAIRCWN